MDLFSWPLTQGAFVAESSELQCCQNPPCQETLLLSVVEAEIEKSYTLPFGMDPAVVSSKGTVSYTGSHTTMMPHANYSSKFVLYQWTHAYFKCQVGWLALFPFRPRI